MQDELAQPEHAALLLFLGEYAAVRERLSDLPAIIPALARRVGGAEFDQQMGVGIERGIVVHDREAEFPRVAEAV